ncbi:hypothetical protein [Lolliginicoccus levis]|uniref:hypothetical protein n=1 Tax=Lolliginicoccus levis TaxID=2919542 RepID=UPI00241ED4B5|nr:hypothetical protein [Lolliginicoccus levis]
MHAPDRSLDPGQHYETVIATRDALLESGRSYDDIELLVTRFGFDLVYRGIDDVDWGKTLIHADTKTLTSLATYLGTLPNSIEPGGALAPVDAYTELAAAETALREVVRTAIGASWIDDFPDPKRADLEAKRVEEDKRRDGVKVSDDLLDYTEAYHLERLIFKHWEKVQPILQDRKRTEAHLKTMMSVRNTIAHARPVAPFEKHLLAGVAGQVQNLLAIYRSSSSGPDAFYASINYVRDSLGDELGSGTNKKQDRIPRLSIGQTVSFECSATDPHDREISWRFTLYGNSSNVMPQELGYAYGATVTFDWTVAKSHVGEGRVVGISVHNESEFQRYNGADDRATFHYNVSPPVPTPRR